MTLEQLQTKLNQWKDEPGVSALGSGWDYIVELANALEVAWEERDAAIRHGLGQARVQDEMEQNAENLCAQIDLYKSWFTAASNQRDELMSTTQILTDRLAEVSAERDALKHSLADVVERHT